MARNTKLSIPKLEIFHWDEETKSFFPTFENGEMKVSLSNSDIVLPVEIKGKGRDFIFTTNTNLGASGVYTSPTYDGSSDTYIDGFVVANQTGVLYIQESDNLIEWFTTKKIDVAIATTDTISSVSYSQATTFESKLKSRYVRVLYVNGTTAQTKFTLSAYLSN